MEISDDDIPPQDDDAQATLEAMRWPNGPVCPFCREGSELKRLPLSHETSNAGELRCGSCNQAFSVTTGSLMEHSRVPLSKWLTVLKQLNGDQRWALSAQISHLFGQMTTDPDLRIVADGRVIRALSVTRLTHRFAVPAGTTDIVILSRSVVPAELQAAQRDHRKLGVCLAEIRLHAADIDLVWQSGDALLQDGFYPPEDGHRWTNGRAVLPSLRERDIFGPITLDIQLSDARLHYALPIPGRDGKPA